MRTHVPRLPMASPPKPEWRSFSYRRRWVKWLQLMAVSAVLRTVRSGSSGCGNGGTLMPETPNVLLGLLVVAFGCLVQWMTG